MTILSDYALGWAWYVGIVAAVFFIIVLILLVFAKPSGPSYDNSPYMMQAPPQAYPLTQPGAYPPAPYTSAQLSSTGQHERTVTTYPPGAYQSQPQPAYPQYPQSYGQPNSADPGYSEYAPTVHSGYPPSYKSKAKSTYAPSAYSGYPPSYHTKAPSGYAQSQAPSYAYPQKY